MKLKNVTEYIMKTIKKKLKKNLIVIVVVITLIHTKQDISKRKNISNLWNFPLK